MRGVLFGTRLDARADRECSSLELTTEHAHCPANNVFVFAVELVRASRCGLPVIFESLSDSRSWACQRVCGFCTSRSRCSGD